MNLRHYDAHNHLQDERLGGTPLHLIATATGAGVVRMVVNGACESDWPAVLALAKTSTTVLPSFGYHPWYLKERTPGWLQTLEQFLDQVPSGIGEIGLDRWIQDHDDADQETVFLAQLTLAAKRNLPASIHCLQAWGRLFDLLRAGPRPERGFLLHSFGGPVEMIQPLAKLGAYFSFPGYFALERKERQRLTFRHVPLDRLLVETDAPDQTPPPELIQHPLPAGTGSKPLNHPANLPAIQGYLATWLGIPAAEFAEQLETNFLRLFHGL